jgi:hypothetical protein
MENAMTLRACVCALLVLVAATASAQMTIQPLQEAKPSPAQPRIEPIEAAPSPAQPAVPIQELQAGQVDLQLNTPEERLKRRVAELERNRRKLEAENAQLRQRVANFTTLGGSEVHAYCAATTVSRNTAGKSRECAPYSCDDVTGQCLTTCSIATDCGGVNANCVENKCTFAQPPAADPDDD